MVDSAHYDLKIHPPRPRFMAQLNSGVEPLSHRCRINYFAHCDRLTAMKKLLVVLIYFSGLQAVHTDATQWPKKEIGGTALESACTANEWRDVQAKLAELADGRAEAQLVRLTRSYLCDNRASVKKELLWHAPKRVGVFSEGTGQDSTSALADATAVLAPQLGNAWRAEVSAAGDNKIQLSFWSNEVCVNSVFFMQSAGNWLISQLRKVCTKHGQLCSLQFETLSCRQ